MIHQISGNTQGAANYDNARSHLQARVEVSPSLTSTPRIPYQGEEDRINQQGRKAEREQRKQERPKDELIHFVAPRIGAPM